MPRGTSPCRGRACRSPPVRPASSRRRASPAIAARRAAACAVRASLQCFFYVVIVANGAPLCSQILSERLSCGLQYQGAGLAFFRHQTTRERNALILDHRTESGALAAVLAHLRCRADAHSRVCGPHILWLHNTSQFRTLVTPTPTRRRAPAPPAAPRPRAPRSLSAARGPPGQTKARRRRE